MNGLGSTSGRWRVLAGVDGAGACPESAGDARVPLRGDQSPDAGRACHSTPTPALTLSGTASDAAADYVPGGEMVVLALKPSPMLVFLRSMWLLLGSVVVLAMAIWIGQRFDLGAWPIRISFVVCVVVAARLLWETLEWISRLYVLTDRRVVRVAGVLRRSVVDLRLDRVQHVEVHKSLRERVFRLGTLGFASAGTDRIEVVWLTVERPDEVHRIVRETIDRYGRPPGHGPGGHAGGRGDKAGEHPGYGVGATPIVPQRLSGVGKDACPREIIGVGA